jgi:hypothetical protein
MSFVFNVYRLILNLEKYALDFDTAKLCKTIESQTEVKLEAMKTRDAFTKYKAAAPGSSEREALRRQYLELAHIHKDWISTDESTH